MSKDDYDSSVSPLSIPIGFLIELSETSDRNEVLAAFARWVKLVLECERISILIPGDDDKMLDRVLVEGSQIVMTGEQTPIEGTTLGVCFVRNESRMFRDMTVLDTPDAKYVVSRGLKAGIIAPVAFSGQCVGLLTATYIECKETLDEDLLLLESMGRCLASFILMHDQLVELSQVALTDPLTKARNRRFFQQASAEAQANWMETGQPFSLLICDLDRFKSLNDTYGHGFGDHVLCRVVEVMRERARDGDFVVRMGGEEFLMFLPNTELDTARELAEHVRVAVETLELKCNDERVPVTTSVGVGTIGEAHPTVRELITAADLALYAAKQGGRNRVHVAN